VLNVNRTDDIDPGVEQVFHVFVAFAVFAFGRIRVREFID